jgi:hypothetical protein
MHRLGSQSTDFHENLCRRLLFKSVKKIQVWSTQLWFCTNHSLWQHDLALSIGHLQANDLFIHSFIIHSFIHSVVRLTTGQYIFPKRVLCRVRSVSNSFIFQCLLVSLMSLNSCLRLIPRLPVTSVLPSFYLSFNKMFRRQFLRKM